MISFHSSISAISTASRRFLLSFFLQRSSSSSPTTNKPPKGPEGGTTREPDKADVADVADVAGASPPATQKKKSSRLFCSYCKKANHTVDTCRAVPGTVTILNGGGQLAPTGCTFRLATGCVEKKKNKKKLAEKVMEQVEAMQLE